MLRKVVTVILMLNKHRYDAFINNQLKLTNIIN